MATSLFFSASIARADLINLIQNGDFENGNTSFSSDLTYDPTPPFSTDGYYAIGTNPVDWFSSWLNIGDHTSGSGNMLIATPNGASNVWYQSINVVEGTEYTFSGWGVHVSTNAPALLSIRVDTTELGSLMLSSPSNGDWTQFSFTYTAPSTTTVNLFIADTQPFTNGNDFALDDLSFTYTANANPVPEPTTITMIGLGLVGLGVLRRRRSVNE